MLVSSRHVWPPRSYRPRHPIPPGRLPTRRGASAVVGAALLRPLDQLEAPVAGRPHEPDARAIGDLDGPLEQPRAEPLEPRDVGLEAGRVETEVLEAVMGAGVSPAERLAGAGAGNVHHHAAILGLAAHEAVAEDARLVAHDLEVEGLRVPVGRLPRIRRFQMNVVDLVRHGAVL